MERFKEFVNFLCEHLFILFSSSFLSLCDRLACVGSARIAHGCFLLCVDTSYEPISLSLLDEPNALQLLGVVLLPSSPGGSHVAQSPPEFPAYPLEFDPIWKLDAGPLIFTHNSIHLCLLHIDQHYLPFVIQVDPAILKRSLFASSGDMAAKVSSRMPSPLISKSRATNLHRTSGDSAVPSLMSTDFVETGGFPVCRKHFSIVQSSYKPMRLM